MTKNHLLAAVASLALSSVAFGADWPAIEDLNFSQRLAITVENPSDVADDAALIHIPLSDLAKTLPDAKAGQVAVIDPETKPAKREQPDKNFVPFQVSNDTLIFAVPLKAHEKKQLFIYTDSKPINLPGFPAKTAYDSRHAYRSFENNLMAFRMETGSGANTTGMGIDLFGKTKAGKGLRLVELYEQGDYHTPHEWGLDILKVGSSPALGGAYVISGEEMTRPTFKDSFVDCLYSGPVETVVRTSAPLEIAGRKLTITRLLTLVGDDRTIHDEIQVKGDNLEGLQLGLALRNLPNETWHEFPDKGFCYVDGDNNQAGCKHLGLACLFDPKSYVKTHDLNDPKNGGHIYILNAKNENGALVSHHRLAAIYDNDGQINKPEDLEKALEKWSAVRDAPVKMTMGNEPEKKP